MVLDSGKLHPHQQLGSHSQCNSEEALRQCRQVNTFVCSHTFNAFSFAFNAVIWPLLLLCCILKIVCLVSLFPVSQSKLSTLQVLCPTMTKADRETLVALATAGIINWQENDSENENTHTHIYIDTDTHESSK